jgi:hypothetical protein
MFFIECKVPNKPSVSNMEAKKEVLRQMLLKSTKNSQICSKSFYFAEIIKRKVVSLNEMQKGGKRTSENGVEHCLATVSQSSCKPKARRLETSDKASVDCLLFFPINLLASHRL